MTNTVKNKTNPLSIWIFQTGEQLLIDGDRARPMRAMNWRCRIKRCSRWCGHGRQSGKILKVNKMSIYLH